MLIWMIKFCFLKGSHGYKNNVYFTVVLKYKSFIKKLKSLVNHKKKKIEFDCH